MWKFNDLKNILQMKPSGEKEITETVNEKQIDTNIYNFFIKCISSNNQRAEKLVKSQFLDGQKWLKVQLR